MSTKVFDECRLFLIRCLGRRLLIHLSQILIVPWTARWFMPKCMIIFIFLEPIKSHTHKWTFLESRIIVFLFLFPSSMYMYVNILKSSLVLAKSTSCNITTAQLQLYAISTSWHLTFEKHGYLHQWQPKEAGCHGKGWSLWTLTMEWAWLGGLPDFNCTLKLKA